jgi:N-acetylglucosamine-6-sulfatase
VDPWSVIHPDGDVKTLWDAVDKRFDAFYMGVQQRVRFDKCELGYILDSEGPQQSVVFGTATDYWSVTQDL